jgi:DNA polymerase
MTTRYEEGDPGAPICIVAEAPSHHEVRHNKPLIGPAGQLFEACLHAAGILRRDCYILNVFENQVRREGDNLILDHDILYTKGGFTDAGREKAERTLDRLEASKANIFVPLGAVASSLLLNDARITKIRGSIYPSTLGAIEGRKVIPTIHPSASLRGQYIWRHFITSDFTKVKAQSTRPDIIYPNRTLHISPSTKDAVEFLHSLDDTTAFDIEIYNHQIYCVGYSLTPNEVMCIPFINDTGGNYFSEDDEVIVWKKIAETHQREDLRKVAQNAIFDISVMFQRNHIHTAMPYDDLMIAHHIIWPDFPKGLDFMTSIHTNEPYYKDEGKQWNKIENPEAFRIYNAKDCGTTHEIWNAIQDDLDDGYRQTYDETMAMFPPFLSMMLRGVKIDRQALEETKVQIRAVIKEKEHELEKASDHPFNYSSPKQCQQYFYGHKGIKPYISRSTGRPTTDDKSMSRIYRKYGLPEAKLVQELRTHSKLLGTYLEVGISSDDRIRCTYNLRGTTTGRPSSSQTIFGEGMNMQNLHPRFKQFLVADEDLRRAERDEGRRDDE